jgi:hypothetical protein
MAKTVWCETTREAVVNSATFTLFPAFPFGKVIQT